MSSTGLNSNQNPTESLLEQIAAFLVLEESSFRTNQSN